MAKRKEHSPVPPDGVLTNDAAREANELLHELITPNRQNNGFRKKSLHFVFDEETGLIRETSTKRTLEIRWLRNKL